MKRRLFITVFVIVATFIGVCGVYAAPTPVSPTFTYQGVIFVDNTPFNGAGFFKLAIVNESGQTLWSNDGTSVDGSEPTGDITKVVNEGVFQIILGDIASGMVEIDPAIFDTVETLHLRSWFDDGSHGFSELTPPVRITSSVYAMNSQYFRGYSPEDFFLNSSQIVSSQIANGAVTTAQIADDGVTGDKITAFSNNNTAFTVGRGDAGDTIIIFADTGAVNDPGLRFDSGTSKWQFSNDGTSWTDIGSGGGGGAPTDATYITQTPNGTLTNEQALSTLANGLMANNAGVVAVVTNSAGLAGQITDETGSGALVFSTSPAIGTPVITGGMINNTVIGGVTPSTGAFTALNADMLTTALQAAITIGPFGAGAGNTSEGRFLELAANGTDYVGFKAPDSINPSQIWTLPAADGTPNQVLQTNGSGVLSWASAGTGDFRADGSVPMTGDLDVGDNNIVNVGNIALDTISSDSNTTVVVTLGTDAGDDFIAGNGNALVVEGDTNRVGINTATPATTLDVNGTATISTVDINGGNIDNTVIGNTTRAAGNFNALDADGNVTLGDATSDTTTINSKIAIATGGNTPVGVSSVLNAAGVGIRSRTINNTIVTASSLIFITPAANTQNWSAPYISAIVAGTSFTVSAYDGANANNDLSFHYLIIN